MNKPVFKYANVWYAVSAILTIPLLIDICTACHLFPLWVAWGLFILISAISLVRLWYAFSQHLNKFAWGLIGQLFLGAAILVFFQLSYNRVIETPVSNPITPVVVNIADPLVKPDSVNKTYSKKAGESEKMPEKAHHHDVMKKENQDLKK